MNHTLASHDKHYFVKEILVICCWWGKG